MTAHKSLTLDKFWKYPVVTNQLLFLPQETEILKTHLLN
jgi:hypothetical protein